MPTRSRIETQDEEKVLVRMEASCEDRMLEPSPQSPLEPLAISTSAPVPSATSTASIVDLYAAGHVLLNKAQAETGEAVPFLHQIKLEGPKGELVRVQALFDDGAMVAAMCSSIFAKVKHRLDNILPSAKRLRMANGTIINSEARWSGTIELNGVRAEGQFEVFDSAGGWAFLFGKPTLRAFNAVHDYTTDSITVSDAVRSTVLQNAILSPSALNQTEEDSSLTMDIKQREIATGGTIQSPPSRQVLPKSQNFTSKKTDHVPEKLHAPIAKPSETPMGQWKPPVLNLKRQDQKRLRQIWKRVESTTIRTKEPQENLVTAPKSINVITPADALESTDQLLGDLPEPDAPSANLSIHTRQTNPFNPARVAEIMRQITLGNDLSEDERTELEEFVKENADTFALSLSEVTPIPGAQVNLNVPETAKFNLRIHQRPLTPEQSRFYNERADEMLKAGLIEKAPPELIKCVATTVIAQKAHETGGLPWDELKRRVNEQCDTAGMNPAFELPEQEVQPQNPKDMISTKPRKWRICQNFAQLNKVTEIAPMPQGDILAKQQRLSGHRYLSVFDFASGFYVIEVPEQWRPYLAFYVEGRGYFWYKRMPMGITGAPTIFCDTLAERLYEFLVSYYMELFMDDGACAANTFQEMMVKLRAIFAKFRECKFSIAPSKTRFCVSETEFAGGTVGRDGVKPDLTKLTAIVDWPQPDNALSLVSFLGLTGFYRTLIQAYAKREGPLRDLLLKVPLDSLQNKTAYRRTMSNFKLAPHWKEEQTRAFLDLKTAITSRPILQAPRYDGSPFVVTSDGCIEGFAAVLSQRVRTESPTGKWNERMHPIAFASKRTSTTEKKYKSYLLEFAALKFGLDKFSSVVWGFPVEIETDCNALKDTLLNSSLNAAHARWRESILAYNIVDIRHVPGKLNVVADGLSRKWEGTAPTPGDGSEWTVSENWEARTGLVNDIMHVAEANPTAEKLQAHFTNEPVFQEVIEAIFNLDGDKNL
jgi:RNase H-like domain found in reverse transcriptase/Reverse transcriptase (RNA-dependent DNA polymerase)